MIHSEDIRKTLLSSLAVAVTALSGCTGPQLIHDPADTLGSTGAIERLHPDLDRLVPADAVLEIIGEGFDWSEGPAWVPDGRRGFLVFSDVPRNTVYKWAPGEGIGVYLERSGYAGDGPRPGSGGNDERGSNGLMMDARGRLVLCQHGERQVARMDAPVTAPARRFVTIADRYDGRRFNSPNDLVFHRNGDLYFTDPPYGLPQKEKDPDRELDFHGVFRVAPDGRVSLVTRELTRPNGIAFSPDYRTLYVANSDPARRVWMAYPVGVDGGVGPGRVLFDAGNQPADRKGNPDGMCVDTEGNLFATGPGGVLVISPEGRHLGTLLTGVSTGNCTFGEDGRTLFITADMNLLRVRLTTRGMGF